MISRWQLQIIETWPMWGGAKMQLTLWTCSTCVIAWVLSLGCAACAAARWPPVGVLVGRLGCLGLFYFPLLPPRLCGIGGLWFSIFPVLIFISAPALITTDPSSFAICWVLSWGCLGQLGATSWANVRAMLSPMSRNLGCTKL